jgi:hypothetical protein
MPQLSSVTIKRDVEALLSVASQRIAASKHPEKAAFQSGDDCCAVGAAISAIQDRDVVEALSFGVLESPDLDALVQALFFSIPRDFRDAVLNDELIRERTAGFCAPRPYEYRRKTVVYSYNDSLDRLGIMQWFCNAMTLAGGYADAQ